MEIAMNVLELVRKQTTKKQALKQAQKVAVKAQPKMLVYRGVEYPCAGPGPWAFCPNEPIE